MPSEPTAGPLIIQSDRTLLLDVDHPDGAACRADIAPFAELERSPEHIHTYRLTPLGLWNASAAGHDAEQVVDALLRWSRYPVPQALLIDVADLMSRYGRLVLDVDPVHGLVLRGTDRAVLEEVARAKAVVPLLGPRIGPDTFGVARGERGRLKQALLKVGWPADDRAGYVDGTAHPIALRADAGFQLRPYQVEAVDAFVAAGSGVIVLPCGAGKTLVGLAAMARAGARTLILVTNIVAARQWQAELLARTTLTEAEVGEYSGERKEIRPVTLATYQIITTRRGGLYPHLELLSAEDWGLVVYDEVHLLPAPVFRMAADIQSRRRLGLTATLVREDGRAGDVFSLIGPKRYDAPWRDIEAQGWIAPARCVEVRVTLADEERMAYALAEPEERYRVGATARSKLAVVEVLCQEAVRRGEPTLVIGQYLDQLDQLAERLGAPVLNGKTPTHEREKQYEAFRRGIEPVLVVSKVANFSIDLPEASVAIQVSGTFGSRQEEAQRLGRILRPKADGRQAHFFTVVARDTNDQEFAARRQRFLAEQGYAYEIVDAEAVLQSAAAARAAAADSTATGLAATAADTELAAGPRALPGARPELPPAADDPGV
ncbi:MAG: excision repair protein [Actinomycetota bacterium]|jgi:DNA excision repair protein ERCC-3|nr:excision repair protein [Actinomycetota bacterium]